MNQLFPTATVLYKHSLKTSASVRKSVRAYVFHSEGMEITCCVSFLFQVVLFHVYSLCHIPNFLLAAVPWDSSVLVGVAFGGLTRSAFDALSLLCCESLG